MEQEQTNPRKRGIQYPEFLPVIVHRYTDGESMETIAADLNIHWHTVLRYLVRAGVERRPAHRYNWPGVPIE